MPSTNTAPVKPARLRDLLALRPGLRIDLPKGSTADDAQQVLAISGQDLAALAGRSVLVAAASQAASAGALIALDGVAARLVICPPDFSADQLAAVAEQACIDAVVTDSAAINLGPAYPIFHCIPSVIAPDASDLPHLETEWVLPTSGTTGKPKLVAHTLAGLTGPISPATATSSAPVWATFYDIRRYGGMQIFLRACVGGTRLLLTNKSEALVGFMTRCRDAGVTHLTGTPSHWRHLLMSQHTGLINPAYVRLSGEIADRAILEALRLVWPKARIVHAYASTEAGVAFEVNDEQEGFPSALLGGLATVDMRIVGGTLRIRSARTALRYIGADAPILFDDERFVDTDDVVDVVGDRCFFRGRRSGVINVGGNKVHPEDVERVINLHPAVSMSRVKSRHNPILGAVIIADVVVKPGLEFNTDLARDELRGQILSACRGQLDRHKVPVKLEFLASLPLIDSGKMGRRHA